MYPGMETADLGKQWDPYLKIFFLQSSFLFRYILNCLITQKKVQERVGPLKNVKNQPKITVKSM